MRKITKRAAIIGTAVVLAVSGAGVAFAAWSSTTTHSATATAGTQAGLTVLTSNVAGALVPGGSAGFTIDIRNDNAYGVNVTAITRTGPITSDKPGCDATTSGVTFDDQTGLTLGLAKNAHYNYDFGQIVHMSNAAVDACQGATFTIPVTVNAQSNGS